MRWEVEAARGYPVLRVNLEAGEEVTAEPGSLLLVRGPVGVQTSGGGVRRALARMLGGGEAPVLNTYRARGPTELWLVPPGPGDIAWLPLEGTAYLLQDGAYLAHWGRVELGTAWRGAIGWLAQGELVWLRAAGSGGVWVSAFGAVEEIRVGPGEHVVVDNFHFVAMEEGVRYRTRPFGGLKSLLLGGEGLVVEVEGPARLWVQTRQLASLAGALVPFLEPRLRAQ